MRLAFGAGAAGKGGRGACSCETWATRAARPVTATRGVGHGRAEHAGARKHNFVMFSDARARGLLSRDLPLRVLQAP
jgi:hypothetical protein